MRGHRHTASLSGSWAPGAASTRHVRTASREFRRANDARTRHLRGWRMLDSAEVMAVALRAVFRVQRLAGRCLRCRIDTAPHGRRALRRQHAGSTCGDNRNEPEDAAGSEDRQDEGNRTTTGSSGWRRVPVCALILRPAALCRACHVSHVPLSDVPALPGEGGSQSGRKLRVHAVSGFPGLTVAIGARHRCCPDVSPKGRKG